ncbi:hypothetical protein GCK72_013749 [Caenorhabditis remanei]|uniref:Uncharacterized protein n=1 Tax=Caenorhabditis remanei TaxID=31234 RepID=A0A6A5GRM9_CAERE|nr:hypothetical protein GCK72_013749 [Caenorhabditis remanei]KAF1757294.1 hypothetical protein GCK72_013749 [Caenorhabditis remanei]
MKYALLIALFILCSNSAFAQSTPSNTTPDPKDKERQECLKDENENRRAVAKAKGISNMRKLEYDKSMEANPMEGFKCPENWMTSKYKEGVWATMANDEVKTAENALATTFACVQNEKCGKLLLTNTNSDQKQRKMGKAGSACSGKVDDGLCIGSAASFGFFFLISFISFFNL